VRIDLLGHVDKARLSIQIDIGFGDVVVPGPDNVEYPVLLEDQRTPKLRAYPKYTVVAEKFEAICKLGMTNSRMKDYFDLYVLLQKGDLDVAKLAEAINATLARRQTPKPTGFPTGLTDSFVQDKMKQTQWSAFLKKNDLDEMKLADVVTTIRARIEETGVFS